MARIRTIKPGFFRHEELFEAEQETGLPLRLAFAGLWTAADREGRFKWAPRALKLDCLPFDDVDFSRVLDALATRRFIVKYAIGEATFGAIPGWQKHQVINNREAASEIPEPPEPLKFNDLTRDARVIDASPTPLVQEQVEGKGREEEREGKDSRSVARATRPVERASEEFERLWNALPARDGPNPKAPALKKFQALVKTGVPAETMIRGALQAADAARKRGDFGTKFIPQAVTWLNQNRWTDAAAEAFAAQNRNPNDRPRDNRTAGFAGPSQAHGDATLAGVGRLADRVRQRGLAERQANIATAGGDDFIGRRSADGGEPCLALIAPSRSDAGELSGRGGGDADKYHEDDAGTAGDESDRG